jgi:hypothetical protein
MLPIALWLYFAALVRRRQFRQPQKLDVSSPTSTLAAGPSLPAPNHPGFPGGGRLTALWSATDRDYAEQAEEETAEPEEYPEEETWSA